ncbi:hypothetical protein GCM10009839_33270 [Catenulispora yoronensis]|uniref:Uncharacterized protein n=1 Tax=Catenulispora yoronensis TaxID=450799 RepID=A0ABP5FNT3_9ACTN
MGVHIPSVDDIARGLDESAAKDFEDLDAQLLSALRDRYQAPLVRICQRVGSFPRSYCQKITYCKVERHVLPLLHIGDAMELSPALVEDFAYAFLSGFSLPILAISHELDDADVISGPTTARILCSVFTASTAMAALPNGARVASVVGSPYHKAIEAALHEHANRWTIPTAEQCRRITASTEDPQMTSYYRSPCVYLTALTCGLAELAGFDATPLIPATHAFGVARQLADEVADLADDLSKGLVTYSIISVLDDNLDDTLRGIWAGDASSQDLVNSPQVAAGVAQALATAERWLSICEERIAQTSPQFPFMTAIRPFTSWKRGLISRLRAELNAPHFNDYRHLPPLDVIEEVAG